jgi:glycosyltransferase involved in cell wall biosynthesis
VPVFTIFGPQLPERFAPLHPSAEWIEGRPCRFKPCSDSCHFTAPHCLLDLDEMSVWFRVERFIGRQDKGLTHRITPVMAEPNLGYRSSQPRRFIQIFCRYLMPGGEENSVARIASHLELAGHQVVRFWRASEEWHGPKGPAIWKQLPLLWKNSEVLAELQELHDRVQPDAWIFHNLLPVVSLAAYRLASKLNVPVVHWLHNYRPLSPSGTMRAGGQTLRPEDRWLAWKEARYGTWHGRLATAALALAYRHIRRRGDFESVKAWVAVSEEMKQIFSRARFAPNRLFRLHHSWDIRPPLDLNRDQGYFLVLSRMVEEKGIRFIVELWKLPEFSNLQLVMAGEGPLAEEYRRLTLPNVRWVGFVRGDEKRQLLAGCRALLFPCLWAEPLTTVVYEAYEQGKPVLASALGGLKELVIDHKTGRLLAPGNVREWTETILEHFRNPGLSRQMGLQGLAWLQHEVSPAAWNRQFDQILEQALPKSVRSNAREPAALQHHCS